MYICLRINNKVTMRNILNQLDSKLVSSFKITEAFVVNNELHLTSMYDLPYDIITELENKFLN